MFWIVNIQGQSDGSCDEDWLYVYLSEQDALAHHQPGYRSMNTCDSDTDPDDSYWFWERVSDPEPCEFIPEDAEPWRWSFGPGVLHTCELPVA